MSPIFLFMPRFRNDAWLLHPQRLGVLVKYGEGPHMSALALIPIALGFTWLALEKPRPLGHRARRLFSPPAWSPTISTARPRWRSSTRSWSGAFWITRQDKRILLPACAIPVLAYGLTAFWLVPSYFKVTAENMKYVSEHGTTWSIWVARRRWRSSFAVTTDKLARGKPERTWEVFLAGCGGVLLAERAGQFLLQFPRHRRALRLVPELDMIYIMLIVYVPALDVDASASGVARRRGRRSWRPRSRPRTATVCTPGTSFPSWPDYTNRVEYRVTEWLCEEHARRRAHYPSGSVRFWFDTWHDLAQVGGGSEQGLLNGRWSRRSGRSTSAPKPEPTIAVDAGHGRGHRSTSPTSSRRRSSRISCTPTSSTACCR